MKNLMDETIVQLEQKLKSIRDEIVAKISSNQNVTADLKSHIDRLQAQADAIDAKLTEQHKGGGVQEKSLADVLKQDEGFNRLARDGRGTAVITLKVPMRNYWNGKPRLRPEPWERPLAAFSRSSGTAASWPKRGSNCDCAIC
jgi:hypothetical protein